MRTWGEGVKKSENSADIISRSFLPFSQNDALISPTFPSLLPSAEMLCRHVVFEFKIFAWCRDDPPLGLLIYFVFWPQRIGWWNYDFCWQLYSSQGSEWSFLPAPSPAASELSANSTDSSTSLWPTSTWLPRPHQSSRCSSPGFISGKGPVQGIYSTYC